MLMFLFNRRTIMAGAAVIGAAVLLVLGIVIANCMLEPRADGRPLRHWLAGFDDNTNLQQRQESLAAISRMGEKGLFALARILESKDDSPWLRKAKAWLSRVSFIAPIDFSEISKQKEMAVTVFQALGPSAKSASPRMLAILEKSEPREFIVASLTAVDLQSAIDLLQHRDIGIRQIAADNLGLCFSWREPRAAGFEPFNVSDMDKVLSALEPCLRHDDKILRQTAAASIDRIHKQMEEVRRRQNAVVPALKANASSP